MIEEIDSATYTQHFFEKVQHRTNAHLHAGGQSLPPAAASWAGGPGSRAGGLPPSLASSPAAASGAGAAGVSGGGL
jgi:hypothetical protein